MHKKTERKHKNKCAVCVTCYRYNEKKAFKIQVLQVIIGSTAWPWLVVILKVPVKDSYENPPF